MALATKPVWERWRNRWASFTPAQRVAVVVAGVALVACCVFLPLYLAQLNYAPLFRGLRPEDAGAVVQKLEEMKVPYRMADGGTAILVPKDQVYKVRAELAAKGALPGAGKGFELFDKTRLGITDFEEQVNYQRALQEELRRTILQFDGVEDARVHLVLPPRSPFVTEKPKPSASVVLKLKPLEKLKPEQVEGIVALVSGAVQGLKPEDVRVIDTRGEVLTPPAQGGEVGAIRNQQELVLAFERELERRVRNLLDQILGPGKAAVMVNADFDFSRQEVVTVLPQGQVPVSERTLTEQGAAQTAQGTAGIASQYVAPGAGGQNYSKQETTRNYQVGEERRKVIEVPGRLRRLTASVVVDGNLDPVTMQKIQNLVAGALGYNPQRGDQITVDSFAFDRTYQRQMEAEMAKAEAKARQEAAKRRLYTLIGAGAGGLLGLVLLLVLLRRLRRAPEAPAVEEVVPVAVTAVPPPPPTDQKFAQVKELTEKRPEEVAEIIKVWLRSEE
ncbi:flagellar basal-body MS-ring/collar protein FliF [Ammonifex thiophilus]|uniref:Flagellar M-ring protein n=1 Tax=Ammonifex thiophilus TaxID=444093 RepID=A0A3D8P849_9THEO|nr:flagellar basal-body MS-ring/collar protein FliF [Ammonifex thiophilus]RDV84671.1 flagellar M-ring protein FliF [Ammonifex thiophilus]